MSPDLAVCARRKASFAAGFFARSSGWRREAPAVTPSQSVQVIEKPSDVASTRAEAGIMRRVRLRSRARVKRRS